MKRGYKQTEASVLPDDWEIARIVDCCSYTDYRGKTPPKSSSGTILVTARNVRKGFIDYEGSQEYVPTELYDQIMRRGRPHIGDILITTEAPLGNVAQVDREDIALAQRIIKYRPFNGLLADYVKQYLLSERFQQILFDHSSGSTAKGIKGSVLHQLPIVIPSRQEQQAIAGALTDVDRLLGGLDRLLFKKRDLKQAAMQQLIHGKTRLPGFNGAWRDWSIAQIFPHIIDYRGRTPLKLGMEWGTGDIPALSAKNVKMGFIDLSEETNYGSESLYKRWMNHGDAQKDDIVITTEAPLGNIALIPDMRKYIMSQRTLLLKAAPRLASTKFLAQLMMGNQFQKLLIENSSGSTAKGIQRRRFEKLKLFLPEVAEQAAIAEILSDMETEIVALAQRREKTRALKQAMMQELLTGKTRLI